MPDLDWTADADTSPPAGDPRPLGPEADRLHHAGDGPVASAPPHDPPDGTDLTGHVPPPSRPGWLDPRRVGLASLLSFLIIVGVLIRNRGKQEAGASAKEPASKSGVGASTVASRTPPPLSLPDRATIRAAELAKAHGASPAVVPDLVASNDGETPPAPPVAEPVEAGPGSAPEPPFPPPSEPEPSESRPVEASQPPPAPDSSAPSLPEMGPADPPRVSESPMPEPSPAPPITPDESSPAAPAVEDPRPAPPVPAEPAPTRPDPPAGRRPSPAPTPVADPPAAARGPAPVSAPPTFAEPPAPTPAPSPPPSRAIDPPAAPVELKGGGGKIPNAGRRAVLAEGGMATGLSADRDGSEAAADPVGPARHVVEPGENFWSIAKLHYGSGRYYKALWTANKAQCQRPEDLRVGDTILIPPPELLDRGLIASADASAPSPGPPRSSDPSTRRTTGRSGDPHGGDDGPALPITSSRNNRRPRMTRVADDPDSPDAPRYTPYKVRPHETLRSIARDVLGDSHRDAELRQLNLRLLGDTGQPVAGQILKLPGDDH